MAMHEPTTDHADIRFWAATHNAQPAEIRPLVFDGQATVLRFLFDDVPTDQAEIRPLSWDAFFALFDAMGLALVYEVDESGRTGQDHEFQQADTKFSYHLPLYPA